MVTASGTSWNYADDVGQSLPRRGARHQGKVALPWADVDAVAVVFHGAFTGRVERVRPRPAKVRGWLRVDDGAASFPAGATRDDDAAGPASGRVGAPSRRTPDDLVLLSTGGTTATVEPWGSPAPTEGQLAAHVKAHVAGFKAPRRDG